MKVLVTGATGLIGKKLVLDLLKNGFEVSALARNPKSISYLPQSKIFPWHHGDVPSKESVSAHDAIVHLAGENIADGRWTKERKKRISDSRIAGTKNLLAALSNLKPEDRPKVLISASAIGYYGEGGETDLDEESDAGSDFLANLCKTWEASANAASNLGIRVVNLRTGVVLAAEGGALSKMAPVVLGSGEQWMSWIHVEDVARFIGFALANPSVSGPYNLVSPNPIKQKDFARALKSPAMPVLLGVPAAAIRLLLGEMSQIVLASQKVNPKRALASGFQFRFPEVSSALYQLLGERNFLDHKFSVEQFVEAPREKVVPFFSRAENLEELTPPWLNFKILKKSSREIQAGSTIDYTLKIHGIPVRWRTLISDWNLPYSFTDQQLRGPYSKWHHVHAFHKVNGGTLLTDHVTYRVPLSWLGRLLLSRWIAKDVRTIFDFRKRKILELEKKWGTA